MLDTEDIKNLTEYQIEVFKDIFFTKEDGQKLETKITSVQTTLYTVLKDKQTTSQEMAVLNYRMKNAENFLDKAASKLDIKYER